MIRDVLRDSLKALRETCREVDLHTTTPEDVPLEPMLKELEEEASSCCWKGGHSLHVDKLANRVRRACEREERASRSSVLARCRVPLSLLFALCKSSSVGDVKFLFSDIKGEEVLFRIQGSVVVSPDACATESDPWSMIRGKLVSMGMRDVVQLLESVLKIPITRAEVLETLHMKWAAGQTLMPQSAWTRACDCWDDCVLKVHCAAMETMILSGPGGGRGVLRMEERMLFHQESQDQAQGALLSAWKESRNAELKLHDGNVIDMRRRQKFATQEHGTGVGEGTFVYTKMHRCRPTREDYMSLLAFARDTMMCREASRQLWNKVSVDVSPQMCWLGGDWAFHTFALCERNIGVEREAAILRDKVAKHEGRWKLILLGTKSEVFHVDEILDHIVRFYVSLSSSSPSSIRSTDGSLITPSSEPPSLHMSPISSQV